MTVSLRQPDPSCTPVHAVDRTGLEAALAHQSEPVRRWLASTGFTGAPDTHALVPDSRGGMVDVALGRPTLKDYHVTSSKEHYS